MSHSKASQAMVFFPLMELKQIYQLKHGEIGPINKLIPHHPVLVDVSPALMRTIIDGSNIQEPVVAISTASAQKFIGELECLGFLTACEPQSHAE